MTEDKKPSGPDLTKGVSLTEFKDSKLLGHVGEEDVLLVLAGSEIFAIEPACSHYHGPLAEGLVVGDTIRCPWHHACFSLRSGEAARPPALNALAVLGGLARPRQDHRSAQARGIRTVGSSVAAPRRRKNSSSSAAARPASRRRRRCVARALPAPSRCSAMTARCRCDRPNLSKDYLAGNAPEDWLPLRPRRLLSGCRASTSGSARMSPRSTRRRAA